MKKIAIILSMLICVFVINAQTNVTEVTTDGVINKASYKYILGSTSDTLTDADTTSKVLRIKGARKLDINIQLYIDRVSGTSTDTLVTYRSIDGVTYTSTGDTILAASVAADALQTTVTSLSDFNYPYLKFVLIQSGTAVTVPKIYIYAKEN